MGLDFDTHTLTRSPSRLQNPTKIPGHSLIRASVLKSLVLPPNPLIKPSPGVVALA
jgi:hypothetical protein